MKNAIVNIEKNGERQVDATDSNCKEKDNGGEESEAESKVDQESTEKQQPAVLMNYCSTLKCF